MRGRPACGRTRSRAPRAHARARRAAAPHAAWRPSTEAKPCTRRARTSSAISPCFAAGPGQAAVERLRRLYEFVYDPAGVLPPDLPQLRRARGHGLRLRRGGHRPAGRRGPSCARAQHLQLLPPQRRRRPARVVVPPLRLPRLVHRRARHAHQRGPLSPRCRARRRAGAGAADARGEQGRRRGRGRREPARAAAGRADRPRPARSRSPSTASRSTGYEGDTIASALYAAGRRTFSRSFKYHRPRGELCGCGQCANSLVQIGGRPGVRACAEPIARRASRSSTRTRGRGSTST